MTRPQHIGRGLFIAGTDTGVGKSVVAASLAAALSLRGYDIGVMKPFQTGATQTAGGFFAPDAEFLRSVSGAPDPMELICPVMLEHPLAPSAAAKIVGKRVTIQDVLPAYKQLASLHEFVIVEAAGGLAVPIDGTETMRELAVAVGLPLLIVARPALGTINHTHLTIQYALAAGLTIAGIVISNYPDNPGLAERTNIDEIEQLTGYPVLGIVPHDSKVDTESGKPGSIVETMVKSQLLSRLMEQLILQGVRH